jgi:hypothetical protein
MGEHSARCVSDGAAEAADGGRGATLLGLERRGMALRRGSLDPALLGLGLGPQLVKLEGVALCGGGGLRSMFLL